MRRAEIRTDIDGAAIAAAAVRPDNTEQMRTRVDDGTILTTIERETTGGLRSTVDDYVVNLDVAVRTMRTVASDGHTTTAADRATHDTDIDTDTDPHESDPPHDP